MLKTLTILGALLSYGAAIYTSFKVDTLYAGPLFLILFLLGCVLVLIFDRMQEKEITFEVGQSVKIAPKNAMPIIATISGIGWNKTRTRRVYFFYHEKRNQSVTRKSIFKI